MIFQVIYRTNETYIGSATSKEALFLSIQQTLTATSRANQTPIQKTIDRDPNIDNYQFHILDPDDNNLEKYILLLKPELNHIPIKDPNNGMTGKTGNLNPLYGKKHSKETILFLKTLKRKTGWKQSAYQKRITSERCKKVKIPPTPEEILASVNSAAYVPNSTVNYASAFNTAYTAPATNSPPNIYVPRNIALYPAEFYNYGHG